MSSFLVYSAVLSKFSQPARQLKPGRPEYVIPRPPTQYTVGTVNSMTDKHERDTDVRPWTPTTTTTNTFSSDFDESCDPSGSGLGQLPHLLHLPSWRRLCIVLSQSMLTAVIKHVVDDNIICFSATQLMHALLQVRATVPQLLRKTLTFISPKLWPQQARAEHS